MLDKLAGWLRQCRFRAKKYGCYIDFPADDLPGIIERFKNNCAYCDKPATCLDMAFPLTSKAPCVSGNALPCCENCKTLKNNRDLILYCRAGGISKVLLKQLLSYMIPRDTSGQLKQHVQRLLKGMT